MNNETVERHLDTVDQRLSAIEAEQRRQAGDIAEMKELLKVMYPLLVASNARGEEQSKRIDDLNRMVASLIPSKIAAVK